MSSCPLVTTWSVIYGWSSGVVSIAEDAQVDAHNFGRTQEPDVGQINGTTFV